MEVLGGSTGQGLFPFHGQGTVELFEVPSQRRQGYYIGAVLMPPVETVLHSFFVISVRGS